MLLPLPLTGRAFPKFPRRHLWKSSLTSPASYRCKISLASSQHPPISTTEPQRHRKSRFTAPTPPHTRAFTSTETTMSYSNADTGSKPADPYKEKNLQDPPTEEKIQGLSTFIKSSKFGMMTTRDSDKGLLVSRCMAVAAQESGGVDLYFHTNTESGKTDDLDADSSINIAFLNGTGEWASISGIASVISDRDVVKKYYSQELRTWVGDLGDGTHDGSENDPRIGVIKVEAKTATYAIARGTAVGRAADMVQGAITGNAAQVNKLREISESEISQYRSQHKS